MKKKVWPIEIDISHIGWREYFVLSVSRTVEAMKAEILKDKNEWVPGTLAQTSPCRVINFEKDEMLFGNCLCKLYLNAEHLSYPIISHEAVHITMTRERAIMFGMSYGQLCDTNEERFAYYQCAVLRQIVASLKCNGFEIKGE
jgi:hypothetical protein